MSQIHQLLYAVIVLFHPLLILVCCTKTDAMIFVLFQPILLEYFALTVLLYATIVHKVSALNAILGIMCMTICV